GKDDESGGARATREAQAIGRGLDGKSIRADADPERRGSRGRPRATEQVAELLRVGRVEHRAERVEDAYPGPRAPILESRGGGLVGALADGHRKNRLRPRSPNRRREPRRERGHAIASECRPAFRQKRGPHGGFGRRARVEALAIRGRQRGSALRAERG